MIMGKAEALVDTGVWHSPAPGMLRKLRNERAILSYRMTTRRDCSMRLSIRSTLLQSR